MNQDEKLLDDFHALPPEKQEEVIDFVAALKKKQNMNEKLRPFGVLDGQAWMAEDFDEPLEDFKDYM